MSISVVRRWALAGALVACSLAAGGVPAASAAARERTIVTFDRTTSAAQRLELVETAGGRVVRDLHLIDGLGVVIDRRAARRIARQPGVLAVTPDARVRLSAVRGSSTSGDKTTAERCDGIWEAWCPGALGTAFVQSTRADKAWADPDFTATGRGV